MFSMKTETVDIENPNLNPMIKRGEDTVPLDELLPIKLHTQTNIARANPLRNRPIIDFVLTNSDLIFEINTNLKIVTTRTRMRRFNTQIITEDTKPLLTQITHDTSANIEEQNTFKSIASRIIGKIEELEIQGRRQESIKEVHKTCEDLLTKSLFEIANQILILVNNKRFPLSILVAFLAVTFPFKNELTCRSIVFEKAEKLALAEFGLEKLGKSIFNNLK